MSCRPRVSRPRLLSLSAVLLTTVMLIIAGIGVDSAVAQVKLHVIPSMSSVEIVGTSNVNSFTCVADEVDGFGRIGPDGTSARTNGELEIPVRSFDCKNGRMSKDLFEALKGEQHPAISFQLDVVRVVDDEEFESGATLLEAEGTLWVAGQGRSIRTRAMGDRLANGYLRATGNLNFNMSDFDIDPPTALLGMVRVRDEVTVRFELTAFSDVDITEDAADTSLHTAPLLGEARR